MRGGNMTWRKTHYFPPLISKACGRRRRNFLSLANTSPWSKAQTGVDWPKIMKEFLGNKVLIVRKS
jgi:hypothetical protein